MFFGWNRRRSGEKKDVPLIEEDVFSLAPFKLPPRKSQHQQQAMQGDQVVTMLAMREKRRVHRYENVPPLQLESVVQRDLILERSATTTPPAVVAKSQDLFGLVPFTALTPRWSPEAESSGTYLMRIIIFFFRSMLFNSQLILFRSTEKRETFCRSGPITGYSQPWASRL